MKNWEKIFFKCTNCVRNWLNKLWLMHTMKYYANIKRSKQTKKDLYELKWRNFQHILLSEKEGSVCNFF